MKAINAFWEKRNLNVDTIEFIIEDISDIQDLQKEIETNKGKYIVVKCQSGNFEISQSIQKLGFNFIESSINVYGETNKCKTPRIYEKMDSKISYSEVTTEEELNQIFSEIKKGIFKTDRIALDPHFGKDTSAIRYINWINDEYKKGMKLFKIQYRDKTIGFFSKILSGMFVDAPIGSGFAIISKVMEECRIKEIPLFTATISSNNLPIIRLYNQFGFITKSIENVFIKHN